MINYKKKIGFSDIERETTKIYKKIEELKLPKGFLDFVIYTLSKLSANVKEHSKANNVLVEININKKNCLIKFIDNGIGLRKSYLLRKIYPKDDFAAIAFALSGLSAKSPQERGFGLYSIRKLTSALNGQIFIQSGFAQAVIKGNRTISKKMPQKIQGVNIILQTPIKALDFYRAIE